MTAIPVMTLPGYRSNDNSMLALRRYLKRWGYEAHPWGLGPNLGIGYQRLDYEERLLEKLDRIVERHRLQGIPRSVGARVV